MEKKPENTTEKGLGISILLIILLALGLAVTTFALAYSSVSVENNLFITGKVQINLNDGTPIIRENEFLFEPGMTVKKDFFLQNESICDVYYKLYFQNVTGGLAEILEVKICAGDKVLFKGTPASLKRENTLAAEDILRQNERRDLQIYFHFPEEWGNETQNLRLGFDFAADAVQVKNNADKSFE